MAGSDFDLTGKITLQSSFTGNSYAQSAEALSKGMYIVQISSPHDIDKNMQLNLSDNKLFVLCLFKS